MEAEKLTEYERLRLENVKRNQAMLAALGVHHSADEIRSTSKRVKSERKGYKPSPSKRPAEEPIVLRKSKRSRGISPDTELVVDLNKDHPAPTVRPNPAAIKEDLPFSSVYMGEEETESSSSFLDRLRALVDNNRISDSLQARKSHSKDKGFSPESLSLKYEDIARVVPERIFNAAFLPLRDRMVVVAGDKGGHLGLWDVDCDANEGDGVHIYKPHAAPVSGIGIAPGNASKVLSCSYDGTLRSMDLESMKFIHHYSTQDEILSALCFLPGNPCSAFVAEAAGVIKILDTRDCKRPSSFSLHNGRINTIHFNPEQTHQMATSSSDRTCCIWDIRKMGKSMKSLTTVWHNRPVFSAYFSPSGRQLATCSMDSQIGLLSGFLETKLGLWVDDREMISHNNLTNRWISPFRAIWGWDDDYIFVPNLNRSIDVISTSSRKVVSNLSHPGMTAISCRLTAHPLVEGTLAGNTGGGQVYIWRK